MDFTKIQIFNLMSRRLDWLGARQSLVGHNIANADTPAFRPKDLEKQDFREALRTASLAGTLTQTDRAHLQGRPAQPYTIKEDVNEDVAIKPSGNAVVLEDELMRLGETSTEYSKITSLYQKAVSMVRIAIGRPTS